MGLEQRGNNYDDRKGRIGGNISLGNVKKLETKIEDLLPKTSRSLGGIYLLRVRCGKARCRCSHGDPHKGFYYIRRIDGKRCKTYLSKYAATRLGALLQEARKNREKEKSFTNNVMLALSEMRRKLREYEPGINMLRNHKQ